MVKEMGFEIDGKVVIRCDSKSAIHIAQNPVHCKYSKHISVRYHFIRSVLQTGVEGTEVEVCFIAGDENCSDIMTKPLGKAKYRKFKGQLQGDMCESVCIVRSAVPLQFVRYMVLAHLLAPGAWRRTERWISAQGTRIFARWPFFSLWVLRRRKGGRPWCTW